MGFLTFDFSGATTGLGASDFMGAAQAANSDPEFAQPRFPETITSNAVDSLGPITTNQGGAWGDFFMKGTDKVLTAAIARDAARNAAASAAPASPYGTTGGAAAPAMPGTGPSAGFLLLIAGVGLLGFMLARKG